MIYLYGIFDIKSDSGKGNRRELYYRSVGNNSNNISYAAQDFRDSILNKHKSSFFNVYADEIELNYIDIDDSVYHEQALWDIANRFNITESVLKTV